MAMHPMSPKLPKPAAFGLLDELNEFLRHPQDVRESALADYSAATEQRQTALDAIAADADAAASDREEAAATIKHAEETVQATIGEAENKADGIVAAANDQAAKVNETVAHHVAEATAKNDVLAARLKKRETEVQAREDACEHREANAFKEREDAVKGREVEVAEREKTVKREKAEAARLKETYDSLIAQISAVQRRAP